MNFNQYVKEAGITTERENFFKFVHYAFKVPMGLPLLTTLRTNWKAVYAWFCAIESWADRLAQADDICDLANTQADAL